MNDFPVKVETRAIYRVHYRNYPRRSFHSKGFAYRYLARLRFRELRGCKRRREIIYSHQCHCENCEKISRIIKKRRELTSLRFMPYYQEIINRYARFLFIKYEGAMPKQKRYLSPEEVVRRWGGSVTIKDLILMIITGNGPPYVEHDRGGYMYPRQLLESYEAKNQIHVADETI